MTVKLVFKSYVFGLKKLNEVRKYKVKSKFVGKFTNKVSFFLISKAWPILNCLYLPILSLENMFFLYLLK